MLGLIIFSMGLFKRAQRSDEIIGERTYLEDERKSAMFGVTGQRTLTQRLEK